MKITPYFRFLMFMLALLAICRIPAHAVVRYEEGRRMIQGIQLLQEFDNPLAFRYVPAFPRLATQTDGTYELLCIKYVGKDEASSGGLFHALVEFTLPPDVLLALEEELQQEVPGARIVGPVDLKQTLAEEGEGGGSFQIVSSILSLQEGKETMARSVITSGYAPLTPGSKAVVAAMLNPEGATLLWNSLSGPTSDVSISIQAYYEAAVKAYNAIVDAEMSVVYEHFSRVLNVQEGVDKTEIRKVIDEMTRDGSLKVEVFDRSNSLGVDAKDMEGILQLVTDKLTELMFDTQAGWAVNPEPEVAVAANQIAGRQEKGFFSKLFGGTGNPKYISDNQFVLKRREDIRTNKFLLNLSRSTTIKVPVQTSGNLGGLFGELENDSRYFRIVNLDDPAFEQRQVLFQIDGDYVDSFKDLVNFASINFRKKYPQGSGHEDVTHTLVFNHQAMESGQTIQTMSFPRLGIAEADWTQYEYQIDWSLKGDNEVVRIPGTSGWISTDDPAVSVVPPFRKRTVEIDADRLLFADSQVASAVVEFAVILNGKPSFARKITLRSKDAESSTTTSFYHDSKEKAAYRVTWYSSQGKVAEPLRILSSDYIFLIPPALEAFHAETNEP